MTNSQAFTHKRSVARCSPSTRGISCYNLHNFHGFNHIHSQSSHHKYFSLPLLVWREYKYTFIIFALINLRFKVSIQWGVFDVPINYHTWIIDIPDHFKTHEMCTDIMRINPAAFFLVLDHFKSQEMCIKAVEVDPWGVDYVLDHFKSQEMCKEAVTHSRYTLRFSPDYLKTQEMCNDVMSINVAEFFLVLDCFKSQEMCVKAVEIGPSLLGCIPDHLKTQEMRDKVVRDDSSSLQ